MDLTGLNEPQRLAVETTEGPLLVLAGAGSGKTRVLTHRIAYLIDEKHVYPSRILALTFTNKAAGEMADRIEKLTGSAASRMWIMTFHSMCARILRMDIDRLGFDRSFVIYDDQDQQSLWKRIIKNGGLNDKIFTPRSLSSRVSEAKNHSEDPAAYLAETGAPREVREAFAEYTRQLRKNNALDFDDLLLLTLELFRTWPEVLEKYRDRFEYILVDEYQDTNLCQYHIVQLLAARHGNLCAVGDDDQSIYGWRGADIRNILEFEKDFPGTKVIRLEQNYRSTPEILEAANLVISNNRGRREKKLWTARRGGKPVTLYTAEDERDEAQRVSARILSLTAREGRKYGDVAVLYRTNAQSRTLEMHLKSAGIPYSVYGGLSFFQRAEVKDILAYLRVLANPADDISFLRIINTPRRGIGQASIDALAAAASARGVSLCEEARTGEGLDPRIAKKCAALSDLLSEAAAMLKEEALSEVVRSLLDALDYDAYLREEKREAYESAAEIVEELIGYVQEYEAGLPAGQEDVLAGFLENVALFSQTDEIDREGGTVTLMTLHSAKGLEFPVVFLCGLEEGLFPSSQSRMDNGRLEEERRLMYVGITRAMDELYLSRARVRTLYGRTEATLPSVFLQELSSVLPDADLDAPSPYDSFRTRYDRPPFGQPGAVKPFPGAGPQGRAFPGTALPVRPAPRTGSPKVTFTPAAPAPKGNGLQLKAGMRVRHAKFGEGVVLSVSGSGSGQIAKIDFASAGQKQIAPGYAPLEILS